MPRLRQHLSALVYHLDRLAHHDLTLIIFLMTVTRLLAIIALRPGGYAAETGPDSPYHFQFGRWAAAGAYPFLDYWSEYPPFFPWLTVLAYKLATLMPAWIDQRFWFNLTLHGLIAPFDAANAVLIYLLSRQLHPPALALKSTWLYALLFTPLFVTMGWFETVALCGVLFFLWAILAHRVVLAGVALGLAALVKPYVLIAAAASITHLLPKAWRTFLSLGGIILLVFGLGFLPFWLLNPEMTQAHLANLLARPAWSTPFALLDGLFKHTEIRLVDRFDPALATGTAIVSRVPYGLVTLVTALVYSLIGWRALGQRHSRALLALTGVTFGLYMLWSKGYSPQFSLYLLALLCILMPNLRGVVLMVVLDALYILEWPIAFILLDAHPVFLTALITVRTLVLLGLTILFATFLLAQREQTWQWVRRGTVVGSAAALLAVIALAFMALPLYSAQQYAAEPLRPAVEMIQASSTPEQAAILFDRADSYERLAPFLDGWSRLAVLRMGSAADLWSDAEVRTFATSRPQLWYLLDYDATGYRETALAVHQVLDETLCPVSRQFVGSALLARYVYAEPIEEVGSAAAFADNIQLDQAHINSLSLPAGDSLCLELLWSATAPPAADYTVFLHLLTPEGQLVAQSDLPPGNGNAPTTTWTPGQPVADKHGLIIPTTVAPGRYQLWVGLYDATGTRLPLTDSPNDALLITEIEIGQSPENP